MAKVTVSVTLRYVEPVDGCVSRTVREFGEDPYADITAAVAYADNALADDPNVYEAVADYSICDRDREDRMIESDRRKGLPA